MKRLATFCALMLCVVPAAWGVVVDFDGPAGTVVSGQEPLGGTAPGTYYAGMTISVTNTGGGPQSAIIFDTENPTGTDTDLGTPNESCGGPGVGGGGTCTTCGTAQSNGPNCVPLGRALIIAENINDGNNDNVVDDPDDEEGGGSLLFEFDTSIVPIDITILDIDGETAVVDLQGDTLCVAVNASDLGDNSAQTINLQGHGNFNSLEVTFSSSGAVAELEYVVTVSTDQESWGTVKGRYRSK